MSNDLNEINRPAKGNTMKKFFAILSLFIMPLLLRPIKLSDDCFKAQASSLSVIHIPNHFPASRARLVAGPVAQYSVAGISRNSRPYCLVNTRRSKIATTPRSDAVRIGARIPRNFRLVSGR